MKSKTKYFAEWLGYIPFFVFYIMSVGIVCVCFYHVSLTDALRLLPTLIMLLLLTHRQVLWSLYGLVAAIPLISGLQIAGFMQGVPILSFSFAAIYLSWFSKRVFWERRKVLASTRIEILVDILSSITILSLLMLCISSHPYYIFKLFWSNPLQLGGGNLYGIQAAYVILQGLFVYRLIRIEVSHVNTSHLTSIIYIYSFTIILFSAIQIMFHIPPLDTTMGGAAVYSPFNDKHSFGSSISITLFGLLAIIYNRHNSKNVLNILLLMFISVCIVLSWSRATWIAVIIMLVVSSFQMVKDRKYILILCSILAGLILFINIFYSSHIIKSDNRFIRRVGGLIILSRVAEDQNLIFRLKHWKRAIRIIADYPLTGSGIGSYYKLSPSYAGAGESRDRMWGYYENAHNYYLQFAADLGLPALAVFLMIIYCSFRTGLFYLSKNDSSQGIALGIIFGLSAYLITCITGHPLLLSNQQLLFWSALAIIPVSVRAPEDKCLFPGRSSHFRWWIGLLLSVVLMAYGFKLWSAFSTTETYEQGVYEYENWGGKKMRWTMQESRMRLKAVGALVAFEISTFRPNTVFGDLNVSVFLDGLLYEKLHFQQSGVEKLYYSVPCKKGGFFELKILVNPTFNPHQLGLSIDRRDLGVAISEIEFTDEMPNAWIGFYTPEIGNWEIPGWPPDLPKEFRWTGKRALMNVRNRFTNGLTLFLFCAHPEVATSPVEFNLWGKGGVIKREVFKDRSWKKIRIRNDEIKDSDLLIFQVSRTWNPMLAGISADKRDLGIAVAIMQE